MGGQVLCQPRQFTLDGRHIKKQKLRGRLCALTRVCLQLSCDHPAGCCPPPAHLRSIPAVPGVLGPCYQLVGSPAATTTYTPAPDSIPRHGFPPRPQLLCLVLPSARTNTMCGLQGPSPLLQPGLVPSLPELEPHDHPATSPGVQPGRKHQPVGSSCQPAPPMPGRGTCR